MLRYLPAFLLLLSFGACTRQAPDQRWVHDIKLSGAATLDRDDVLEGISTQETSWWSWTPLADKQWYEEGVLEKDLDRIKRFYASHGFFRTKVVGHKVTQRKDGRSVDVEITLEEGQKTVVSAVEVDGLDRLPKALRTRVTSKLGVAAGERFDHEKYLGAKQRIGGRLKEAGHAYARVGGKVLVERDQGEATIKLLAEPGPMVKLGKVKFVGNGEIPADKLTHLVTWNEGDTYDSAELTRTKSRLFNQRVFSSVRIELPDEPTTVADTTITLEPTQLKELRLGLGLGIEQKLQVVQLKGRWIWRNFMGGLRTLTTRLNPGYVFLPNVWDIDRHGFAVESDVKLTQPDMLGTGVRAFALVGYDLGVDEGYRFHGPRLKAGLERALGVDYLVAGLAWNLQFFDFFDINTEAFNSEDTPLGLGFMDPYHLSYLEQYTQLDLRDSLVDPRAGFWMELRLEGGHGDVLSNFTYFKVVPEARGYIPLGTRRVILALKAKLGYIYHPPDSNSPVTRRLRDGGPTKHRGFSSGRLSPQVRSSSGDMIPLGGHSLVLFSADVRIRVFKLFGQWLGLSAFADAGDVTPTMPELDLSQLHVAVGGSLLYTTPIGAIRIGVGVRLNRLSETQPDGRQNPDPDQRIAFHLTIGEAF